MKCYPLGFTMEARMFSMLAVIAACAACTDRTPTAPGLPIGNSGRLVAEFECHGVVRPARQMTCNEGGRTAASGPRAALYNSSGVKLTSSNVQYDSLNQIFAFDVTIKNLTAGPMGTTTGADTVGLKAFYETGPTATALRAAGDTGTVSVRNADGYADFTASHQPYHHYVQILPPGAVSSVRRWELHCPPTVVSFSFTLRVFTRIPGDAVVTDTAPNGYTISQDSLNVLYSPSHLIYQHPRLQGPYPRSIILVAFRPGTMPDERQSAIDWAPGRVIGGGGLFYHVVVRDDGTGNPLWQAIDRLRALPQVETAVPDLSLSLQPLYRIPNDGSGWQTTDWQLVPDSAFGRNWSLEAIGAPFAWGCEENGSTARGAVVDVEDMHSVLVTSILSSPGNDASGITGVVWRGNVTRTDASRAGTAARADLSRNLEADMRAAVASAAVINLSFGTTYYDSAGQRRLPIVGSRDDSIKAADHYTHIRGLIRAAENLTTNRPLYVVAAGNFQMDAKFSSLPQLAGDQTIARRVIVVAGTDSARTGHTRAIWAGNTTPVWHRGSDTGPLVEIAAPGANVVGVENGNARLLSGTSYAAPYVAGVALLMKSFDPRLSADSLKILLLQGAVASGWTSGGLPFLSAYESLKLTAQRSGAPLCGNRVWRSGGSIMPQRKGVATPLFLVDPSAFISDVQVLHGGKSVRFYDRTASQYRLATWANGSWSTSTIQSGHPSFAFSAPSYLSWESVSHDEDSVSYVIPAGGDVSEVYVASTQTGNERLLTSLQLTRSGTEGISECTKLQYGGSNSGACLASVVRLSTSYQTLSQPTYSPLGNEIYLGLNSWTDATMIDPGWVYCPGYDPSHLPEQYEMCRGYTRTSTSTFGAIYAVNLRTGTQRVIASQAGTAFLNMSAADGGSDEFNTERSTLQHTEHYDWALGGANPQLVSNVPGRTCVTEYRRLSSGGVLFTAPSCGAADVTFSPFRAPGQP